MSGTFQMEGLSGSIDGTNLAEVTISYRVQTLEEALTVGGVPPFGLIEKPDGRKWTLLEAGLGYQVDITYEGLPDGKDADAETYDWDPDFKEEPIASHPSWKAIKDAYKGTVDDKGKAKFEEFLERPYKGGLGGAQSGAKVKNPLFGLETYLVMSVVFRRTYISTSFPSTVFERVGSISKSLPGGFPTPTDRDWLMMPPKVTKKGNAFQIREERKLSPPGGWPPKVYALIEF